MELRSRQQNPGAYRQLNSRGRSQCTEPSSNGTAATRARARSARNRERHSNRRKASPRSIERSTRRALQTEINSPNAPNRLRAPSPRSTRNLSVDHFGNASREDNYAAHTDALSTTRLPPDGNSPRSTIPQSASGPMGSAGTTERGLDCNSSDSHPSLAIARNTNLPIHWSMHGRGTADSMDVTEMECEGALVLQQCKTCGRQNSGVERFWLLPQCMDCATREHNFQHDSPEAEQWSATARYIRLNALSSNTCKRYESILRRERWPLRSVTATMEFVKEYTKSESAMRAAMAAACKLHSARGWAPPPFDHQLVAALRQAAKRAPVQLAEEPPRLNVFTRGEIKKLFDWMCPANSHTYARDATIFAIQLFGARRASEVLQLRINDIVLIGRDFRIRIKRSKMDQQGRGHFFFLPHNTKTGINPSRVLEHFIQQSRRSGITGDSYVFNAYDCEVKKFTTKPLSLRAWNKRLEMMQTSLGMPVRSSHALRSTAISLSSMDDVHVVAQVGAWKSMQYLTTYHRTPIEARMKATANIGSRSIE